MEVKKMTYVDDIIQFVRSVSDPNELSKALENYHENDIADAIGTLTKEERFRLYEALGVEGVSEVFAYLEDEAADYLEEIEIEKAAEIIENMDSDDAVDLLESLDEERSKKIVSLMDEEMNQEIELIRSFDEDEIGSRMTTNYISILRGLNVKQVMRELICQAEENDNIYTIYICNEDGSLYGALDLKDLITARSFTDLEPYISTAYPFVYATEHVSDCLEKIKDYAEDSIPVVDADKKLLGVITSQNIIEVVDEEFGDDYAKLAGLTSEEDLNETLIDSMKKRLPWLVMLLGLGIVVSSVVGMFEAVVAEIAIIVCFQSLILDMAGNVGTQSLAVTIRVLMDENLKGTQKLKLIFKEMRVGFCNGLLLGGISFIFVGLYVWKLKKYSMLFSFAVSGCVGASLLAAMVIASVVGTVVPMFFHKIKVDPAVASGPLITTVNDLVAVISYYGLAWLLLIKIFEIVQ